MKNVYDIRHDENLYYVLPRDAVSGAPPTSASMKKIAVFASLYYIHDLDWYIPYLKSIPEEIMLFVFSSQNAVLARVGVEFRDRKNFRAILKNNRGRDISALLVAGREFFFNYKYVCFIHDKSWRLPEEEEETIVWRYNLWENMIATEAYILNLLNVLETREDIGLLCPPEPIGEGMRAWYYSAWSNCFEKTRSVAEMLRLDADISKEKPPVSLSTVFWCRTSALKKLMEYPWEYTDLPDEPLPKSGTISHGIERVFAYVAQDAGYKTAMVMTDGYAAWLLSFLQYHIQGTFMYLEDLHIPNFHHIDLVQRNRKEIIKYCSEHEEIYLYGAGIVGQRAMRQLTVWGYQPKGFVVTNMADNCTTVEGLPVQSVSDFKSDRKKGVFVTVGRGLVPEIETALKENHITGYFVWPV